MLTYIFDQNTKEFLYSEEAFLDPLETEKAGKPVYLLPADSTFTEPLDVKEGYAVCWNGTAWEYIEDHRQKRDMGGVPIEGTGTAFWLPEDTWQSQARYMQELGPLPEGALLVKPEKPEEEKQKELQAQYTALIQSILDTEAQKLGYDNCLSVCSYVDTGVTKYDTEGKAFRQWRSEVWEKAFELMDQIQSGEATMPTEEELRSALPELVIDYEAKGYTI